MLWSIVLRLFNPQDEESNPWSVIFGGGKDVNISHLEELIDIVDLSKFRTRYTGIYQKLTRPGPRGQSRRKCISSHNVLISARPVFIIAFPVRRRCV
jgi:hypothetical protein